MLDNHWYILGAGSIGCLFSCMFQRANIHSTLLVRPQLVQPPIARHKAQTHSPPVAKSTKAISFTFLDGSSQCISVDTQATDCTQPPIRQLLLTTKAHQSQQAINDIKSRLTKDAIIVVMQNGMGVAEQLQAQLPHCTIIVATTTEGANRPTENAVIHAGSGETWIGNLVSSNQPDDIALSTAHNIAHNIDQSSAQNMSQCIVQQWQRTGLSIQYDQNISLRIWIKLAVNSAINPLTVKYQCANGALLDNPEALALMQKICLELKDVMTAKNIPITTDLFSTVKQVARNTQNNISSMLQDHRNHRPTEIHYINGYVVTQGQRLNIPTPINQALIQEIDNMAYQKS
ncbi:MAG: hypothetical protein COA99_12715 [Moraxellaceae bacterium]|nr:MAG: hypothetical protein COA99_12715 [Moraxellaceae bacterium]